MRRWLRQCALCYSAGTLGGLAKGGLIWLCGNFAMLTAVGDQLATALRPAGFYSRLVWAGFYGLLFLLPFARSSLLVRGLLGAAVVSLIQLVILPLLQHGGLHLFTLTTLSLLVLNGLWGIVAVAVLRLID